ncbi:PqiC family protein [Acetobacter ascendens]|uniref:ABC-type transport auxiliary lipoprotein component domain-containing protein n=1 Tax=Acetobacter ascendens TaxID=481146 RepID=A0A1Y0V3B8_9PROT|nr:ABC-type transport auxiliary lipoprotein family protein [Acetobacter ascendens]ARW10566.1 hypothetical protein S101447_01486 [Acetobacter ascendens]RCL07905.1 hypothetical protein BBA71_04505 [Acetobacter pasteurianus]GCD76017.1 hypothetical protein NBRC3299_2309 [Acetobacter pasteurianus NBRC 3299]
MTQTVSCKSMNTRLDRRMLLRLSGVAGLGVMAVTLTACSGGSPSLYTLAITPGQPQPGGPRFVEVRLPTVASGLDRDRIVTADSGYKLTVSSADAWSDSLPAQISRVMAGDLAQRLPGTGVFVENDTVATEPEAYVDMSISRFSTGPSGNVELDATLSIQPASAGVPGKDEQYYMQNFTLQGTQASATMPMVQVLSQLLGQLADVAAQQLRQLPSGQSTGRHTIVRKKAQHG